MTEIDARLLVTGASGFVGRSVVRALSERGCSALWAPARAELDCDDAEAMDGAIRRFRPTVVVHLAASLDRSDGSAARRAQWADTVRAGRNVLEAARECGVPHVIALGSMEEPRVLADDVDLRAVSAYGLSKALLRSVAQHVATTSATAVDWVRPPIVYGPGQTGDMLLPSVLQAAARGEEIAVTDGAQVRDFLFVDDLAEWVVRCVSAGPGCGFEVHEVGSGTPTPVREVFELIQAAFPDAHLLIGARSRRAGEQDVQVAAPSRSGRPGLATWSPRTTLREGIERTAGWWRTQIAGTTAT